MSRSAQVALMLALLAIFVSLTLFWGRVAPDLTATWLAGYFFASGDLGAIYPPPAQVFSTETPPGWAEAARGIGYDAEIFPYIYPPLWAALTAPLTGLMSLSAFNNIALVVHHLALVGTIWLAWRTAARDMSVALYIGLGLVILATGPFAPLALFQNQPQILVGFLTVLAIERARAGAGFTAGAALGLAVALKIAPILILPALLAAGSARRTALGFGAVGGGLGLISLALAGWPLHREYLGWISTISGTAVLTPVAYTFDALIAQIWALDAMEPVAPFPGAPDHLVQWVLAKGIAWRAASALALGTVALMAARAIRRGSGVLIWPALLILAGLASPVAWSFHYLAPLAFLPALAARLGQARGTILALALALPGTYLILPLARDSAVLPFADQALGVATLTLTAAVLAFLARRG